jgi:hypothetical protein
VYNKRGEYEKALEQYEKCLKIQTKTLGPESIQVATVLKNIKILKQ